MTNPFQRATRARARLRLAVIGPSGSGKTWTVLTLAEPLAEHAGGRVALIDTERGSASLYADRFNFDVLELSSFAPQQYIDAIAGADAAGYPVIVIDSLSHAWAGPGGVLEFVDATAKRQQTSNTFGAWREGTKLQNALVDAMLGCRAHLIVTLRSKQEYVQEQGPNGRTTIRKVGMQPVQRDGLDYEFTVTADMDTEHNFVVGKTRIPDLTDLVVAKPDRKVAERLIEWLDSGAVPAEAVQSQAVAPATNGATSQPAAQATRPQQLRPTAESAAPRGAAPMTQTQAVGAAGGWQDRPATEPQIKAIYTIARGMHAMDDEDVDTLCRNRFGCVPGDLGRRDASNFIDAIKLLKAEPAQPDPLPASGDEPLSQAAMPLSAPVRRSAATRGAE